MAPTLSKLACELKSPARPRVGQRIFIEPRRKRPDPKVGREPEKDMADINDMEEEPLDEEEVARGKKTRGNKGETIVRPNFPALSAQQASGGKSEFRRVAVPPHRYTPLRKDWMQLYTPIVEHLKLDVRMNPRNRSVEIKTSTHTDDVDTLQKAADFVRAYLLGFEICDAVALLRVEDLFVDTFMVTDVKILKGDHLSRAVGRIAGKDGKCKYAIENATKTRIILVCAFARAIIRTLATIFAARRCKLASLFLCLRACLLAHAAAHAV